MLAGPFLPCLAMGADAPGLASLRRVLLRVVVVAVALQVASSSTR